MNWLATLPSSQWWDIVPALIGAVIGALAGGVPAYFLAVRTSKEAQEKENQIVKSLERGKAIRIFVDFQNILNESTNDLLLMEEMLAPLKISAPIEPYRIQRHIRPLANLDHINNVFFRSDDLTLFFESDQVEFAQELILCANRYHAIVNSLKTFRALKDKSFPELLNLPNHEIEPDGKVVSKVGAQDLSKIRLREAQAESVIAPTLKSLRDLVDENLDMAEKIGPNLKSALGNQPKTLSFEQADIERLRAMLREARSGLEYLTDIPLGS